MSVRDALLWMLLYLLSGVVVGASFGFMLGAEWKENLMRKKGPREP